jgi:flagellar biosynthesis protein FliP
MTVSLQWIRRSLAGFLILASSPVFAAVHHEDSLAWAGLGAKGSLPWGIVVLLTLLTLIPALLLCMTPFVRLLVIVHFLRQALGTQTTPTNQTLIGLALILTWFLMQPVGAAIYQQAIVPYQDGKIGPFEALDRGSDPVRHFMLRYAREKDLSLFIELAHEPIPPKPDALPMRIVAPAYIISELKAGFQIGAALFLPFLVIDMVVAAITTSVGMLQLLPVVISTPLKILLFVMVDGWNLLIGSNGLRSRQPAVARSARRRLRRISQ